MSFDSDGRKPVSMVMAANCVYVYVCVHECMYVCVCVCIRACVIEMINPEL